MSMPLSLRCYASGKNYYEYSVGLLPDEKRSVACPVCGKPVTLKAKHLKGKTVMQKAYHMIPAHNRGVE